jgi:opacity protein-like surface antigen
MNTTKKLLVLSGIASALVVSSAFAQNRANTFYMKADGGANWTADADLEDFFGPVAPDSKVEFEIGPRFGVAGGYNVTDWFATEFEFGFMWNEIDSITDASVVDAVFGNGPFLVNLKLELPGNSPVIPYVGAGAGGSFMFLDIDYIELGGVGVWGTENAVTFAYQFFGGVRFRINDQMSVGVEYRYTATGEPDFESDWGYHSGEDDIGLGRIESHSVSATFTFRF